MNLYVLFGESVIDFYLKYFFPTYYSHNMLEISSAQFVIIPHLITLPSWTSERNPELLNLFQYRSWTKRRYHLCEVDGMYLHTGRQPTICCVGKVIEVSSFWMPNILFAKTTTVLFVPRPTLTTRKNHRY